MEQIFRKFQKTVILGQNGHFSAHLAKIGQNEKFYQKSGRAIFLPLLSPNFMPSFRKIVRAVSEKSWKNLIFGHFLPSGGRAKFFLDMRSSLSSSPYWGLTSCKKSERSYDSIFRKVRKTVILGQILPFLPSGGRAKFFFENRALSLFIIYHKLTPCQKLENSYDGKYQNFSWPTNQPTN